MPGIWPGRTLRRQLALAYTALFAGSAILLLTIRSWASGARSTRGPPAVRPRPPAGRRRAPAISLSVLALAIAVLLSLTLGWLMAGRLLRPLRAITAAAREISASNLHRRLRPGRRGDELTELAETLNDLFGRLEPRSRRSGSSWPAPRTNCLPRSPRSGPCSR